MGEASGALPIPQDARVSRLVTDQPTDIDYRPASRQHGVYAFVIEGQAQVQGTALARRDSLGTWGVDAVPLRTGAGHTDLLIVETVM